MSKLKVIENQKTIGELFNNLSRQEEIPISIKGANEKRYAMMRFLEDQEAPYIVYRDKEIPLKKGEETEVTFFYKETFINFYTQIDDVAEEKYFIKRPSSIRTSYKRTKTRYTVKKEDNVFMMAYGMDNRYPIIDISTSGLSFEADAEFLERGQAIRNIMINFAEEEPIYVDGVVKYSTPIGEGHYRYGVEFLSIEWIFYQKIFSFIFEKVYPDIKQMRDCSLEDISNLYSESKYIRPKNEVTDKNIMKDILRLEQLKDKPMIAISLVHQKDENISAIASAVRNFERSFYVQQILALPGEEVENIQRTDMYAGISDSMLGHPYFESLAMYLSNELEWNLEMFKVMEEIIDDSDKVVLNGVNVYDCIFTDSDQETKYSIEATRDCDDFLKFIETNTTKIEIDTFSYSKDDFWLNKLKESYSLMGYFIERNLFEIKEDGNCIAYAVGEVVSEQIDIDGYLNNIRVHVKGDSFEMTEVLPAIEKTMKSVYKDLGISKIKVILEGDFEEITDLGWSYNNRLLMSREGVVEFLYFLKANTF